MDDNTRREIQSIMTELESISRNLESVADGIEKEFKGIGENIYSKKIRGYASKYRRVKKDLSNIK